MAAAISGSPESLDAFIEQDLRKELLRFSTAGSVDDGKSTLIGRLLHDSKAVYEDQLASLKKNPVNRSGRAIDFSLLTDGLKAEREQGITIDVAYRYFSTPRRKFIIADTPGHEEYTRNMATGASTSDLAIILVDATKGLLSQTRRHAHIAALLGIPSAVAAINKMDLAGYSEEVFRSLEADFQVLAARLGIATVQCIPLSALDGDNVVSRSSNMHWYSGPSLLEYLESVPVRPPQAQKQPFRFPVQSVVRPDANFRGFAGQVAGGSIRAGDSVLALPSKQSTRVRSIITYDGDRAEAAHGEPVVLKLEDEIDLSRGDMLVASQEPPAIADRFAATVVWLHSNPLRLNNIYLAKHTTRQVKARASQIRFRVDVNSLLEQPASDVPMNGIALVEFETNAPLFFDPYANNRATGSLILIDPQSNATVGAAMIRETLREQNEPTPLSGSPRVALAERRSRRGHHPAILWITGSRYLEVAAQVERQLFERGFEALLIDGEEFASPVLPALLSALWSAGLVIVFGTKQARIADRTLLSQIAADARFKEIASSEASGDEALISDALAVASHLRLTNAHIRKGKVD